MNRNLLQSIIPLFVLFIFFIAAIYVGQTYEEYYMDLITRQGWLGIFIYIFITALATVAAPLTSLPLIPIAVSVWGPILVALASIVGWVIGAVIAFYLSRRYGRTFVEKIVSAEKIDSLENKLAGKNIFWSIVILRMFLPVDALSYALGLSKMITWKTYILATFIGIVPFAFIFSYAGTLPLGRLVSLITESI